MAKNNGNGKWTTLDSYRAAFLNEQGFKSELQEDQIGRGKFVHVFEKTPELLKTLQDYDNGAVIEALRFSNAVKSLKTLIYSLKKKDDYNPAVKNQF